MVKWEAYLDDEDPVQEMGPSWVQKLLLVASSLVLWFTGGLGLLAEMLLLSADGPLETIGFFVAVFGAVSLFALVALLPAIIGVVITLALINNPQAKPWRRVFMSGFVPWILMPVLVLLAAA